MERKRRLKLGLANIAASINYFKVVPFMRAMAKPGCVAILYHECNRELFERHVRFLKAHYNIISLEELVDAIKKKSLLPKNSVVITFDDGYKSLYTDIFPVVKEYGVPVTIYLTTGTIGTKKDFWWGVAERLEKDVEALKKLPHEERARLLESGKQEGGNPIALNWDEIREMDKCEWVEFGSHTLTHPILTTQDANSSSREIRESKKIISEKLGHPVKSFSYPNGDFEESHVEEVKKAGYTSAITVVPGLNTASTDRFRLRRVAVDLYGVGSKGEQGAGTGKKGALQENGTHCFDGVSLALLASQIHGIFYKLNRTWKNG